MKIKKLIVSAFAAPFLLAFVLPLLSCAKPSTGAAGAGSSFMADDEAMREEEEKPRDVSSPAMRDEDMKVDGLPEDLVWFTSRPGVLGSARARQGGTFRGAFASFPETFRTVGPQSGGNFSQYLRTNLPCVDSNPETGEWMPAAATHWAFGKDGKTVYFALNGSMEWSDGVPVTADDYLFMLAMMRDKNIIDPWVNEYYTSTITAIRKYGSHVISVHVGSALAPDVLLATASVTPRPAHFYGGAAVPADFAERYNWKAEPTTGPYYLAEFAKDSVVVFKKVKAWWGHAHAYNTYRYNIDTLEFRLVTGGPTISRGYFYKGEYDTLNLVNPQDWADSASRDAVRKGYVDRYTAYYVPRQGLQGVFLNARIPPFSNIDVRTGLYYALNMQKMIDTALHGDYARYHNTGIGHVFAGINFDDDTLRVPAFDEAKAAEYFERAGYTKINAQGIRENAKGAKLSFELLYGTQSHTERLSVLREEAKRAGLDIQLKLVKSGAFISVREKKFQAYWGEMNTEELADYREYIHSSSASAESSDNFSGWSSPETDALTDRFRAEISLDKKAAISRQIQKKILDAAIVIPGYYVPFARFASWKWIRYPAWLTMKFQGEVTDPVISGYQWIDERIKDEVLTAVAAGTTFEPRAYRVDTHKSK